MAKSPEELRKQAAEILKMRKDIPESKFKELGVDRLIEELSIYQVELELQNEELRENQEALRKSEERYLALFEDAPNGYVIVDQDFSIIEANSTLCKMLGKEKTDLVDKSLSSIISPDFQDYFYLQCRELFKKEKRSQCEIALQSANGKLDVVIDAVIISDNGNIYARLSIIDVSEIRAREEKLAYQAKLLESTGDALMSVDAQGLIRFWNKAAENLYKWKKSEVIGKPIVDITPSDQTREEATRIMKQLMKGEAWSGEFLVRDKDGRVFPVHVFDTPVFNDDGEFLGVIGSSFDISETKEKEHKIQSISEDRQNIIESISDGFIVLNENFEVEYFNHQAERLLGRKKENVLGKPLFDSFPEAQGSVFEEVYTECIRDQKKAEFETYFGKKPYDNWYSVTVYPNNGGITVYFQVITERKIAEAALQDNAEELARQNEEINAQNEELMTQNEEIREANSQLTALTSELEYQRNHAQQLLDIAGVMFVAIDRKGEVTLINKKASDILGYSEKEILGKNWFDIFIPEHLKTFVKSVHQSVMNDPDHEYQEVINEITRKDGEVRQILWNNSQIIENGEILGSLSSGMDVTEQLAVEKQLKDKEAQLLEAQHMSRIGSWEYDIENDQPTWAPECYRFFGYNPDEDPPSWEKHRDMIHPDFWEDLDHNVAQAIEKGIPYEAEFIALSKQGFSKWGRTIGKAIKDESGRIVRLVGTIQDITAQKKIEEELREAKKKAEESDRLKSVFLANMSHEIRTPMNGIMGFAQLLCHRKIKPEQQQKYIGIIHRSGERMLTIINNLINISRLESGQVKVSNTEMNVSEIFHDICDFFDAQCKEKKLELQCINHLNPGEDIIISDKDKLQSIVSNLVNNAIKYTRQGSIKVEMSKESSYLQFVVEDTGIGIEESKLENIFERFVQADLNATKEYEGAGLGLAIIKGYLDLMGGNIKVESQPNRGSKFIVQIPYEAPEEQEKAPAQETGDLQFPKKLKILIVEDNEISDMLLSAQLEDIAESILHCVDGEAAINTVKANPDLDLVLMDIKLPRMDGFTATRKIREFNKDVIIIGQTAYAQTGDREKVLACGCNGYVSKPIDRRELMEEISGLIK